MKKLYALLVVVGVAGLVGCPSGGGGGSDKPLKLAESKLTVKMGESKDVKVSEGKAKKAEAPADSKLKADVKDGKVVIDAKDAKEGTYEVKVTGEKGDAKIEVKVAKKEEAGATPPKKAKLELEKADIELAPDKDMTVKVKEGKAAKAEVPADSKLKAEVVDEGKGVKIETKGVKEGEYNVTVTGEKDEGKATIKVTVKK